MIVEPITRTSTRPTTEPTYTSGVRMRTQRWSVASTAPPSTEPDHDVGQVPAQVRRGVTVRQRVVADVADQTSSVPITRIAAAASTSTQSSRGGCSGCRRARDLRHQGHRVASGGAGGRIEPSAANVGSRVGGVTPGIARLARVDLLAVDAVERLPDLADRRARTCPSRCRPG